MGCEVNQRNSEIVHLLYKAQKEQETDGSDEAWTAYYAILILSEPKT
ncbi:MAG: hypothetical protein U9O63_07280 [Actinomycetota bacterium]|nr:hypothetical protein [Actinomycetota bacterium]